MHQLEIFSQTILKDLKSLPKDEKQSLVLGLWPHLVSQPQVGIDENFERFLDYVGQEFAGLERYKDEFAAQTLQSMLALVQYLMEKGSKTDIARSIHARYLNFPMESVIRSMELAARLWLTVNVRTPGPDIGPVHLKDTMLPWPDNVDLSTAIQGYFDKLREANIGRFDRKVFDAKLTIVDLVDSQGIQIFWTDNLLDHLRVDGDILFVYKHKLCLEHHLRSASVSLLPAAVTSEAIDTFNLLFVRDWRTRAYLESEKQPFYSVGNCGREVVTEIDHYEFWRGRLLAISDLIDRQPRTLNQLWRNRRNTERWFAFWSQTCSIAIAVVGIVITTIASVVSTFYTAKQYELARAQACLMPDAEVLLPDYCD